MYITYETAQYSRIKHNVMEQDTKRVRPLIIVPNDLPKTGFMPTKLVRISDMKVVDGSQLNEGYCALSYSWNQSGDILLDETTGKYKRVDEGKHEIISYDNMFPDMVIPPYKIKYYKKNRITGIWSKLSKMYNVLYIMEKNEYYFTKTINYVKFEGIIQQICRQFNIKYIWYDQLCINQDDEEEKHREIRNMHHIYENAYLTVALVPEYKLFELFMSTHRHQYFKRLWTLEESMKSKRLLFVGRDEHLLGDGLFSSEIYHLTKSPSELNASQILHHAHKRTSTKDHDRVFALIHLFPELKDEINIDYDQELEDLMIQFYGLLAKKDISILFFKSINNDYQSTIKKYKFLPSWTGANGQHINYDVMASFQNYNIIGKTMHVTTTYVPSIDDDNLTIQEEDIPTIPENINDGGNKRKYHLCILVQLSETKEMKIIILDYYGDYWNIDRKSFFDEISQKLQQLSRFVEVKKENLCWCHKDEDDYQKAAKVDLDMTDSLDDPSAQYAILSEISFKSNYTCSYPVIKKKQGEEYYKAIGCCHIRSNEDFFSDCNLYKETFLIQ